MAKEWELAVCLTAGCDGTEPTSIVLGRFAGAALSPPPSAKDPCIEAVANADEESAAPGETSTGAIRRFPPLPPLRTGGRCTAAAAPPDDATSDEPVAPEPPGLLALAARAPFVAGARAAPAAPLDF